MHRLDLGLFSHPKEFGGMESEPMLTPREKSLLPGKKNLPRGGSNPQHCITQRQRAQHTSNELFRPPQSSSNSACRPDDAEMCVPVWGLNAHIRSVPVWGLKLMVTYAEHGDVQSSSWGTEIIRYHWILMLHNTVRELAD